MELTQSPFESGLLSPISKGKVVPTGGASSYDSGASPYIRVLLLASFVIGGLFLAVSVVMFCSHCIKRLKQLKRSVLTSNDPERGQYRSLIKSLRQSAVEKVRFAQALSASATVKTPEQVVPILANEEKRPDNYIDYAFEKYKNLHPDSETLDDDARQEESHDPPPPPSRSHRDADDDVIDLLCGSEVNASSSSSSSSSPSSAAFRADDSDVIGPRDAPVNRRRHVSFELRGKSANAFDEGTEERNIRNSFDGLTSTSKRGPLDSISPLPSTGSNFLGDHHPTHVPPVHSKPPLSQFYQDPKSNHHPITIKVDVHNGRTSPDLKCEKVKVGGLRSAWLSAAMDNRKFRFDEDVDRIHWNSLEERNERKLEEGVAVRLVNSYDEQIVRPPNWVWYEDPLRITEFLNGPCADDDELSAEEEKRLGMCPPKKMKVFELGTSLDHRGSEDCWRGRRGGGGGGESSRLDHIIATRKDSIGAIRNKAISGNTFRSIAISRTVGSRDRDLERSVSQGHGMMSRQLEPSEAQSEEVPTPLRQTCGRGLRKGPTRTQTTTSTTTTSTIAGGKSFDHVTIDNHGDISRSSSSRRLHQMRDDSGYRSLETQQQLGRTITRSLDVHLHRTPGPGDEDSTSKSLDSHHSHPLLDDVASFDDVTTGSRKTQKQEPSRYPGSVTVTDDGTEDDSYRREKNGFLTVPLHFEGGSRVVQKASGQRDVSAQVTPATVSGIFPLRSFEELLHRAENYISSAVSQAAENILAISGPREDATSSAVTPSLSVVTSASIAVTPYTQVPDNGNISQTGEPSSLEKDDAKVERSTTMTSHALPVYRAAGGGGGVLLPVWSQHLGKRPAKEIDEVKDGVKVGVKVGVMRRGGPRTASKRRREWGSRKQLTEACESVVDWPRDPPSSGQGQGQGQGSVSHSLDTDRPVSAKPIRVNSCDSSIAESLIVGVNSPSIR